MLFLTLVLVGCLGELNTYNGLYGVRLEGRSISDTSIYQNFLCGTLRNTAATTIDIRWYDHRLDRVTDIHLEPGEGMVISYMVHDVFMLLVGGEETLGFTPTVIRH